MMPLSNPVVSSSRRHGGQDVIDSYAVKNKICETHLHKCVLDRNIGMSMLGNLYRDSYLAANVARLTNEDSIRYSQKSLYTSLLIRTSETSLKDIKGFLQAEIFCAISCDNFD